MTAFPTVQGLSSALRRGQTSAVRLARSALRRIDDRNPTVNAFALVDADGALAAAQRADADLAAGIDRGPLHGVPVAVKDIVDMAGLPTTCGSASSFGTARATADAAIVTRLRRAGAVIVGKTTLHELAYGATGDRSVHGPSRNPADPTRISGGSSGGSAVAVAAGMVPLAIGTDTVGSVRVPAALCGVVGFKPAHGALPTDGVHPLAPTLDHIGLFAGTVHDVLAAYCVLIGHTSSAVDPLDGPPVAWIPPATLTPTDPRVARAAYDALAGSGVHLHRSTGTLGDTAGLLRATMELQGHEAFSVHAGHIEDDEPLIDPDVLARLRTGRSVTADRYAAADRERRAFRDLALGLLDRHPVLAVPTVPVTAPRIGQRTVRAGAADVETRAALLSLTSMWNAAGVPAVSVPAGHVDGLPVGLQLIGRPGDERRLLGTAAAIGPGTTVDPD